MRVFVTGGAGGIGSEICRVLEEAGIETIKPTSKELDLREEIPYYSDEVDGFIHCAGINILRHHETLIISELLDILKVNTISFVELCRYLNIREGGSIIAIGSLYATQVRKYRLSYTMSKHALYGAVKTIALEKAIDKIKVNMISPGFVDTELTRKTNDQGRIDYLEKQIPLSLVKACEIANLCLYLLQQNNSITGQNIIVDGGYSLLGI